MMMPSIVKKLRKAFAASAPNALRKAEPQLMAHLFR
jgi:hypothetical protein